MFWVLSLAIVVLDQASKWWMLHHGADRALVGDVLRLTLTRNTGAAFGLFPGARSGFVAIAVLAAAGLVYAHRVLPAHDRRRPWLALILGGNLGNLLDRVRLGHVTDFIDMGVGTARWPVYNAADVAVVAGAVGLAWLVWRAPRRVRPAAGTPLAGAPPDTAGPDAGEHPADVR